MFTILLGDKNKLLNNMECDPLFFKGAERPACSVCLISGTEHIFTWKNDQKSINKTMFPQGHEAVLGGRR